MEHITSTELALLYDGCLNPSDTERARAHIEGCSECRAKYQVMGETLNDLKAGRIRKLSNWRFKRLWNRILSVERAARTPAPQPATTSDLGGAFELLPGTEPGFPVLVTASGPVAYAAAAVYREDGRLQGEVAAECDLHIGVDGSVSAEVRVLENIADLDGKGVCVELSNNVDQVVLGPATLARKREGESEILFASVGRDADPAGGLTAAQLEAMYPRIKVKL